MDDIDKKIINILQENARTSIKTIAEKTYLSSPAVSSRLEKLEREGIITRYRAQVDYAKVGYPILAFINVEVAPSRKGEFYSFADQVANILECNYITGNYSMIMKVAFKSTAELDTFVGRLQEFGRTSTQIVFSTHVGPRGIRLE